MKYAYFTKQNINIQLTMKKKPLNQQAKYYLRRRVMPHPHARGSLYHLYFWRSPSQRIFVLFALESSELVA